MKITLLGDGGVGKSTLINKHLTGEFKQKYIPTLGVEVYPLNFETEYGNMALNIWDCAGQERFGGLKDGYYIQSQGLIVMFDLTSKLTFSNVGSWIKGYKRLNPNDPIVICANKCDIVPHISIDPLFLEKLKELDISYVEISTKTNYNVNEPFLEICRKLKRKEISNKL